MFTASITIIILYIVLKVGIGNLTIIGVPLWASFITVIGGCVQILVGVVADYKDDGMITAYKSLWYFIILPVSFALGFVAYLLIGAGLLNITQGQIVLNQSVNQTITTTTITQIGTNQNITQTTTYGGTVNNTVPMVVCFLAGFATDWFMGLLGKMTHISARES